MPLPKISVDWPEEELDQMEFVMQNLNDLAGAFRTLQVLELQSQAMQLAWATSRAVLDEKPDDSYLDKASDHAGAQQMTVAEAIAIGDKFAAIVAAIQGELTIADRALLQRFVGPSVKV
ncbi:MAG: hypothetical protein ACPGVG_15760 [Mycobacterium sp.]